jgi:hypothetical protein
MASQCFGLLKMLITPSFLLAPRIFLFMKAQQALPLGGTHTRAGTLSSPQGCFSLTFLIVIPGFPPLLTPVVFLPFTSGLLSESAGYIDTVSLQY